jgi:hypothetical protein
MLGSRRSSNAYANFDFGAFGRSRETHHRLCNEGRSALSQVPEAGSYQEHHNPQRIVANLFTRHPYQRIATIVE